MRAWNCHAVGTLGDWSGTGTNGFLELCFGRGKLTKLPKVGTGPIKVAQNTKSYQTQSLESLTPSHWLY